MCSGGSFLPRAQPVPQLRRPAVLLVDDARVVLRVVERALTEVGFKLSVAESAAQAVELLGEEEFSCALVDRNLVEADGLDLIKDIRTRQPGCACILMTAYPSLESAVDALRNGVVDYIQKPSADFYRIVDRVQKAIRLHRVREGELPADAPPRGRQELARAAGEIAVAVRALQHQIKPRGRAMWNRVVAEAEAHAAALRARR
ncbi:MAG TPA: response regulator [Myxococcales bacterium]|nr:response regulator [Myxococcales bacterium]